MSNVRDLKSSINILSLVSCETNVDILNELDGTEKNDLFDFVLKDLITERNGVVSFKTGWQEVGCHFKDQDCYAKVSISILF